MGIPATAQKPCSAADSGNPSQGASCSMSDTAMAPPVRKAWKHGPSPAAI